MNPNSLLFLLIVAMIGECLFGVVLVAVLVKLAIRILR